MFHRQKKSSLFEKGKNLKNLQHQITATQFLAEEKRSDLIHKMRELTHLEAPRYESLCTVLIENLINYCQNLPATNNSYFSQPGGLVDYALQRTEAALSLFKEFLVLDQPEVLSEEQKLWQYALYSAAILQGIGALFVDFRVNLLDSEHQLLEPWNPLIEPLNHRGNYYHYEFKAEPETAFRRRLNLLLAKALMPDSGFAWISSHPQILAVWLALLNEDEGSAGTLGAILIRADALAIQRYLLEYLIKNKIGRSAAFGRVGTFSDVLPESVPEKERMMGVEFIHWMINALDKGLIMINKAPLFMVPAGLVMCQEMFQLFVREHPEYKNWLAVQKGFLSLGLHQVNRDGSTSSRFEQNQTHQMLNGIVFSKYAVALPEALEVMQPTGKTETISTLELINRSQVPSSLTQQQNASPVDPLQKLSAKEWTQVEPEASRLTLGAKQRG